MIKVLLFKSCLIVLVFLRIFIFGQCIRVDVSTKNQTAVYYKNCQTGATTPIYGLPCNPCVIPVCSAGGWVSGAPKSVIGTCPNNFSSTISSSTTVICSGSSVMLSVNSQSGYSYQWYLNGKAISGATGSSYAATTPGNYYCRKCDNWFTQTCINSNTISLTSAVAPVITSPSTKTICSGTAVNLSLTSNLTSSFSWKANENANVTGETTALTASSLINNTLTNSTSTTQNVDYTVTSTLTNGNCTSTPQTVTITVLPNPIVTSANTESICSGSSLNMSLTSNVVSIFSWVAASNANVEGETTTPTSGSIVNNTLKNSTPTNQNVIYTAIPTSTIGNCLGTPQTITITVIPSPTITSVNTSSICSGSALNLNLTASSPSTFSWVATSNANVTGETTTPTLGATINNTLTNSTSTNQNVIYTATPTSTIGNCIGTNQTITITVIPTPTMTSANIGSICSGSNVNLNLTANSPSMFSWVASSSTNVNGETTTPTSSSIINNTLTNSTSTNQNVLYTVTPTSTTGSCAGTPQIVTITVLVPVTPSFNTFNALCTNSNFNLPTSSNNSVPIQGSWIPSIVNTSTEGTFQFVFTPHANQCALTTSASIIVTDSITWTGNIDSDWHKPCNWNPQAVPTCCQVVYIPFVSNLPIISGIANCQSIVVDSNNGSIVTINTGANLNIQDCNNPNSLNSCP